MGAGRCRDFKTVWVDLGGSGGQPPDRVTWRRCDGRDQSYPTDRLLLTMHGANPTELYTNAGDEVSGGLRSIEAVRLTDAGNQLLWVEQMYGTGNIYEWKVADWRGGKLRIWSEPDDVPTRERLKRKKSEEITHQEGQGPVVRGRKVVLGYVIHGGDDCHACSTGGYAKVELVARDGAFDIVRAWQEP